MGFWQGECSYALTVRGYELLDDIAEPDVVEDHTTSQRDIVKCCGSGVDQAASFFSPSTNWTPRITSASSCEPLRARQCCSAH